MKLGIMFITTLLLLNCDTKESTDPLYGKWVLYKKVKTTTVGDQVSTEEEMIDPTKQECSSSCYMEIKKKSLTIYYLNIEGNYESDVTSESPKADLNYRIDSGELILISVLYPNNTTLKVETFYKKYDGALPPEN